MFRSQPHNRIPSGTELSFFPKKTRNPSNFIETEEGKTTLDVGRSFFMDPLLIFRNAPKRLPTTVRI